VEFVADADGVNIEVSAAGIEADLTPEGVCAALAALISAIDEAHIIGIGDFSGGVV
jgi:hypothetical protein